MTGAPSVRWRHQHQDTPIEALEWAFPLRVRRCRLRRGSGGAGEFTGRDGLERDLEVLADATVSRTHAVIGFRAGHFHVEDLDSANGTKVGCDAIGVRELEHGDHVRVGAVELQLIVEEREAPPPTHVLDVD